MFAEQFFMTMKLQIVPTPNTVTDRPYFALTPGQDEIVLCLDEGYVPIEKDDRRASTVFPYGGFSPEGGHFYSLDDLEPIKSGTKVVLTQP